MSIDIEYQEKDLKCCANCLQYNVEDCICERNNIITNIRDICYQWEIDYNTYDGRFIMEAIMTDKNDDDLYTIDDLKCCGNCRFYTKTIDIVCMIAEPHHLCDDWEVDNYNCNDRINENIEKYEEYLRECERD